jgi:hypothetical protein
MDKESVSNKPNPAVLIGGVVFVLLICGIVGYFLMDDSGEDQYMYYIDFNQSFGSLTTSGSSDLSVFKTKFKDDVKTLLDDDEVEISDITIIDNKVYKNKDGKYALNFQINNGDYLNKKVIDKIQVNTAFPTLLGNGATVKTITSFERITSNGKCSSYTCSTGTKKDDPGLIICVGDDCVHGECCVDSTSADSTSADSTSADSTSADVDCVLGDIVDQNDCTAACGTLTQSTITSATGSGTCSPNTYDCQPNDGTCSPDTQNANCVLGAVPTAADCLANCRPVVQEITTLKTGTGSCNPGTMPCNPGDGHCPTGPAGGIGATHPPPPAGGGDLPTQDEIAVAGGCDSADITGNDGIVDIADLLAFLGQTRGPCVGTNCVGDINIDGNVDIVDLLSLLGAYGKDQGIGCEHSHIVDNLSQHAGISAVPDDNCDESNCTLNFPCEGGSDLSWTCNDGIWDCSNVPDLSTCGSVTGSQGFENMNKTNNDNNNLNNLLNMNNTHKNLLFVLLLIVVIFFLFKDKK